MLGNISLLHFSSIKNPPSFSHTISRFFFVFIKVLFHLYMNLIVGVIFYLCLDFSITTFSFLHFPCVNSPSSLACTKRILSLLIDTNSTLLLWIQTICTPLRAERLVGKKAARCLKADVYIDAHRLHVQMLQRKLADSGVTIEKKAPLKGSRNAALRKWCGIFIQKVVACAERDWRLGICLGARAVARLTFCWFHNKYRQ